MAKGYEVAQDGRKFIDGVQVVTIFEVYARLDHYLKDFDCEVLTARERREVIEEIMGVWDGK